MTFLRTFREKYKREVRILIIFFSSLVIFTLMANSDTPIILRLIGFQLIYGIGVGFLFFRASVKTLLLALAFHITLFILDFSGALVLDGVFLIILERTKIDSSLILLYCTLFASIALVFISLLKLLKWSMKHLNLGARRQKDELKINIVTTYYLYFKKWLLSQENKTKTFYFLLIIVIILVMVSVIKSMFINIHQEEAGVLFERFSGETKTDRVYKEGLHIITPFDYMTVYKTHEQQHDHKFSFISKNGLPVIVKVSIRFTLLEENLPYLHKFIGTDYLEKLLLPMIESITRKIYGSYDAYEIYRSQDSISGKVKSEIEDAIMAKDFKYLKFFDLFVLELKWPEPVLDRLEE